MHNSQNEAPMAYDFDGTSFTKTASPKGDLLIHGCLGCHSATNGTTWKDSVTNAPIVFNTAEPTYNTLKGLSGGNFYWVAQGDDAKGHNVGGIGNDTDEDLSMAPGHANFGIDPDSDTCGGCHRGELPDIDCSSCHFRISSCRSCHVHTYHHADDSVVEGAPGTSNSYRFISRAHHPSKSIVGWPPGWPDVMGIEDDDWQYTASSNDHNEYANISEFFCSGCHSEFHAKTKSEDQWIRHPSACSGQAKITGTCSVHVIPDSGEYASYTTFDPLVPVERPASELQGWTGPSGQVRPGTDMVSCLSCHRVHASPYPDILRWDYSTMVAGGSGAGGCFTCHTRKNQTP